MSKQEEKQVMIHGKRLPWLLVIQYASVRHSTGIDRVRVHKQIVESINPCKDLEEWAEEFNRWIELFIHAMGTRFPHVFEFAKPPKQVYGIEVKVSSSWKCKTCGYHVITTEPPSGLPCWKAVWMFNAPDDLLKEVA